MGGGDRFSRRRGISSWVFLRPEDSIRCGCVTHDAWARDADGNEGH